MEDKMKTDVDPKLCTGCQMCQLICSLEKEGVNLPREARLMIVGTNKDPDYVPRICRHCPDAPCAEACPTEAIVMGQEGLLLFFPDRCTQCEDCVIACRFQMLRMSHKTSLVLVCDGCGGRFPCIDYCPTHAIARA